MDMDQILSSAMDSRPPHPGSSVRRRIRTATEGQPHRPARINYPRKRVSVACDVCRSRKTRCDAAKPSCHFCQQLGITCVYRRRGHTPSRYTASAPSRRRRQHSDAGRSPNPGTTSADILDRLVRLESLVQDEEYASPSRGDAGPAPPCASLPVSPPQPFQAEVSVQSHWQDRQHAQLASPYTSPVASESSPGTSPIFGYRLDSLSRVLSATTCIPELTPLETTEDNAELDQELFGPHSRTSGLFDAPDIQHSQLDLSPRTCWNLEQAFSRDVLPWCPVIEQRQCSDIVARVAESGFGPGKLETGMTLLIMALGSFVRDNDSARRQSLGGAVSSDKYPGLKYFHAGRRIVNQHRDGASRYSIECLQCELLIAFYLLFSLKPVLAFEVLHAAALRLLMLLQLQPSSSSSPPASSSLPANGNANPAYQEMLHRAYWTCYLLEHELQGHVSFSGRLLQGRRDFVPLPLSDYDEPGMYWFLSEITLRGICSSMPDGAVWTDHMFDAPMLVQELSAQLMEWHTKLAPPVRFPLDDLDSTLLDNAGPVVLRPLLDPHKAFLRAQLYAVQATMLWPSVVRIISGHDDPSMDPARVKSSAAASLRYGILHVYAVEPLMQERHLMLFANITGLFCVTMQLLCAYGLPQLAHLQQPGAPAAAACALNSLRIWSKEPNVMAQVWRVETLMRAKGITVPV